MIGTVMMFISENLVIGTLPMPYTVWKEHYMQTSMINSYT